MTVEERRVIEALQAHTGGLIVTEQDTHDARLRFRETLERPAPSPVRPFLVIAAAAVVALAFGVAAFQAVVGDESSTPPVTNGSDSEELAEYLAGSDPTHELLAGMWRHRNLLIRFTTDGELTVDDSGRLLTDPAVTGTFTIAGDLITVNGTGGVAGCEGEQWAMRASLPAPGTLHTVATLSGAEACTSTPNEQMILQQVLPPNPQLLAELEAVGQDLGERTPLSDESQLYGDWLAQDGEYLLEMSAGGGYYVAQAGGVVDRGRWRVTDDGSQLRLTSTDESPTCSAGDRLVWGDLSYRSTTDASVLRATTEQNACGASWASEVWILLQNEN